MSLTTPSSDTTSTTPVISVNAGQERRTFDANGSRSFVPLEPSSWQETELTFNDVTPLALRFLAVTGTATGRKLAEQLKLPFTLVQEMLQALRTQMLVVYKGGGMMGDYEYELTSAGLERSRQLSQQSTYYGAAPVSVDDYVESVKQQTLRNARPRMPDVRRAFADMQLSDLMLSQLGQAINAGRGLFLYGPPGNGKSSIAERLVRSVSDLIWIPRTLSVNGELIRLYDPVSHQEVPLENEGNLLQASRIDRRWVRIRRPTVIVGGELTLAQLEVTFNPARGIQEAPLQMKSNGGCLVIDDFGRQRCGTQALLDRMIVPMERGCDFISLPSGRQLNVPFDQLLVFSTNLEPNKVCEEAFLRRVPYKFEVQNPTELEFRELFQREAKARGFQSAPDAVEHLLSFFRSTNRPLRFCFVRDVLTQAGYFCEFHDLPKTLDRQIIDVALKNYFAGL